MVPLLMRCGSELAKCHLQSLLLGRGPAKIRLTLPKPTRTSSFSLCWQCCDGRTEAARKSVMPWHESSCPTRHSTLHCNPHTLQTASFRLGTALRPDYCFLLHVDSWVPFSAPCVMELSVYKQIPSLLWRWLKETLCRCLHWELRKLCFAWNTILLERRIGKKTMVIKSWVFGRFSPEWSQWACHVKVNTWQHLLSVTQPNPQV